MGDSMIVNMEELLKRAQSGKYAVPQFNINNLEWTKFILEECEANKSPVIIGVSEGAIKYMGGYKTVANLVKTLVADLKITVPVAIHLDHGSSVESCLNAISAGFSSVMIDASKNALNLNIDITNQVVKVAHKYSVTVESEIGMIDGVEDGVNGTASFATVEECMEMYKKTKIDALAPALGSVHGIYKGEPNLQFKRMLEISNKIPTPLVLHGGSGISDEKIREAINCGICKINVNTELQIAWCKDMRHFLATDSSTYDPRKIIKAGEKALKKAVRDKILLFGSNEKA